MQSPSLPADSPQVVSIDSLKAALAKLNTKVPVDDVISAIREVEQTKRGQPLAQSPERCAALESERKSSPIALVVSLNLSNMPVIHPESSSDVQTTTTSHCVPILQHLEMFLKILSQFRRKNVDVASLNSPKHSLGETVRFQNQSHSGMPRPPLRRFNPSCWPG